MNSDLSYLITTALVLFSDVVLDSGDGVVVPKNIPPELFGLDEKTGRSSHLISFGIKSTMCSHSSLS